MSMFYNSIFSIELTLRLIISPRRFFLSKWNWISFVIILSSISALYLEVNSKEMNDQFLKSTFLAMQLFRFVLVVKDILFLKKFFNTLKLIFIKSIPFLALFFLVLFVYSLIGFFLDKKNI